jgi:hypothetical protein
MSSKLVLAGIAGLVLAGVLAGDDEATPPERRPVHGKGSDVERLVLEAARGYLREDAAAAKRALDGVAKAFDGLRAEEESIYGEAVVNYDQAFRVTVDRARELAAAGAFDESFDQFVWIQRTCRICHAQAREAGLGVELSPSSDPARHPDGLSEPPK